MHARPTSSRRQSPDATPGTPSDAPPARSPEPDRELVGSFRLELPAERWTWSDEVYVMHGFGPGDVVPSTDLLVSHQHPEDSQRLAEVLRDAAHSTGPIACVYRMLDAHGESRVLGIVGSRHEGDGPSCALEGYFVDLTDSHRRAVDREATAAIVASSLSRSTIEQAKGIIMAALGVDDERALGVLRRFSNDSNVPLREVAQHLVASLRTDPSDRLVDDIRKHLARVNPERALAIPTDDQP